MIVVGQDGLERRHADPDPARRPELARSVTIVDFSTRRPVTVFIFAVAAVVFGLVAFRDLAIDLLARHHLPLAHASAPSYEGAAPARDREPDHPAGRERGRRGQQRRVACVSSSRADVSEVTLEFAWGTNMDFAALDVRERLDVLRAAGRAERPVLLRYDPSLDPIMRLGLDRRGGSGPAAADRRGARSSGCSSASTGWRRARGRGGLEEEIQVEIDERRLASLGLDRRPGGRAPGPGERQPDRRPAAGGADRVPGAHDQRVRCARADLEEIVVDTQRQARSCGSRTSRAIVRGHKEREIITRIDGQESRRGRDLQGGRHQHRHRVGRA